MKKIYSLIFVLTICFSTYAQIAITEIFYDTPIVELGQQSEYSSAGEFIELFNYTKKDIDLSAWRLSDKIGSYYFPQGTIIRSGDFIIVARKAFSPNQAAPDDYFFELFPNEQNGNENKLLYQNKMLLNNFKETVKLSTRYYGGHTLRRYYTISSVQWNCKNTSIPCSPNGKPQGSLINSDYEINPEFDYYLKSFNKKSNQQLKQVNQSVYNNSYSTANPFNLSFTPQLLDDEDISTISTILFDHYDILTWDDVVSDLVNNNYNTTVNTINEHTVTDTYIEDQCFNFDTAGNQEEHHLCSSNSGGSDTTDNSLEEIANQIYVAPNPTNSTVTISWEAEISNLITQIQVVPINGGFVIPVNFSSSANSSTINLSSYNSGLYVSRFILNSGQVVTKTIIKI